MARTATTHTNPHRRRMPPLHDEDEISTRRAGELAARALGRQRPFTPDTVRGWTSNGLESRFDEEANRIKIGWGDLKQWLHDHFGLALVGAAALAADPALLGATDAGAADVAGAAATTGAAADLGPALINPSRSSRKLHTVECPGCDEQFHVTPNIRVADCPNCGETLHIPTPPKEN